MSTAKREYDAVKDFSLDQVIARLRPFARETTFTFTFGDRSKLVVSAWIRPDGEEVITRMNAFECKPKVPKDFTPAAEIERELQEPR